MTYAEPEMISVEEAQHRGVYSIFGDVAPGRMLRVSIDTERSVLVMVDQDLADIEETMDDLFDSLVAVSRLATDKGSRTSLAEALVAFGITPEELAAIDE